MSKRTPNIQKGSAQKMSAVTRSRKQSTTDFGSTTFLYRFVYGTRTSLMVAFFLLASFLLQGVETTYAAEETVAEEEVITVIEENNEPEVEEVVITEEIEEVSVDEPVEELPIVEEENAETEVLPEEQETDNEQIIDTPQEVENETATFTEESEDAGSDIGSEEEVTEEDEGENTSGTVEDEEEVLEGVVDPEVVIDATSDATTTEEVVDEAVEISENTFETVSIVESDSAFSFTKDQCTELATGSFYCLEPKENTLADALFAAQDEEGDMEIYFIRNNEQVQVTNNTVDDAAPYYDQNTNTIVWHRLVEDRFQIISYDIDRGSEEQITRTSENNMEPNRQGKYTVWQRWIDGGWNIILFDGSEEMQLTKTVSHNVAPYIHGTLVVWNRHSAGGEKTIEMYDITTEAYVTIDDPDGLSVSNPRMVFVYDSLHPNGDIVTKGYDVLARKFIELDTLPRDLPEEIPHSDSTGETRALIQSKPSLKSEVEEMTSGTGSTTPSVPPPPVPATSTEALTLDLSVATTSEATVAEPIVIESFDLVIPPLPPSLSSSSQAVQE